MTEDKYEVHACVPQAAIRVCRTTDPQLSLKITLSSLAMREEHGSREEGIDPHPHPSSCFRGSLSSFIWPLYEEKKGFWQEEEEGWGGSLRHVELWMTLELYCGCNLGEIWKDDTGRKAQKKRGMKWIWSECGWNSSWVCGHKKRHWPQVYHPAPE